MGVRGGRHVREGDSIRQFDKVADVQSDKATVEITSRYDGIVRRVCYPEGAEAPVGDTLLDIETSTHDDELQDQGMELPKGALAKEDQGYAREGKEKVGGQEGGPPTALPSVRKYARDGGIADLSLVKPTGHVTFQDVEAHLSKSTSQQSQSLSRSSTKVVLTPFQQSMRDLMTRSALIPHLGLNDDYYLTIKQEEKRGMMAKFVYHLAHALGREEFRLLNGQYEGGNELLLHGAVNVGIAVNTPHGLAVPVLANCQERTEEEIGEQIRQVALRARQNRLDPADMTGATVTVSNVGAVGTGTYARPVLVPPQLLIVALGHVTPCPRPFFHVDARHIPGRRQESNNKGRGKNNNHKKGGEGDDQDRSCHRLPVTWAADHRVIDGALVARLSLWMKQQLEK
jgi:2-oxoisovalerate dehydrogenase E2 component (dihydrolipoyl transacylase)